MRTQRIVIWSGGADSTIILLEELLAHPSGGVVGDVVALTLEHPQVGRKEQRIAQDKARTKFKQWLWEKHRRKVAHHTVTVRLSKDCGAPGNVGQYGLFLAHLFPYMVAEPPKSSVVLFGYVRGDDFWHERHRFDQAFSALAAVARSEASLEYPLEWARKDEVMGRLDQHGVPRSAWWTCENPIGHRACGLCIKCEAVNPQPKKKKRAVVGMGTRRK